MLKLCGVPVSNYYNKVKLVLLEKGVPFEEERHRPGKDSLESGSPMGKVPFLRTEQGLLCESQAIIEYIEELYPNPPLYPRDPFARAKCRELIDFLELYLDQPARRLFPEVYFGGKVSDEVKASAREQLEKGMQVLAKAAKFAPYFAGAEFTYADCAACAHMPLISQVTKKIYGEDFLSRLPAVAPYLELLQGRAAAKKVKEDRKAYVEQSNAERAKST